MIHGPLRAVVVLAVTQVLSWGILFYTPALMVPLVAEAHGWTLAQAMLGFSLALAVSGVVSPASCRLIDRLGGRPVMSIGALVGACGLALLPYAATLVLYVIAWCLIGVALASLLYDQAFTALARIFGTAARRPITFVTFAGGFASTVSWPATHILIDHVGWRATYLIFAAVLAVVVAPLHAFALPPPSVSHAPAAPPMQAPVTPATAASRQRIMLLLAAAFAAHAFVLSGMTAHLIPILQRGGIDASMAVMIGALFGPAQVMSRLAEFLTGNRTPPLRLARLALAIMACAFAALLGLGLSTPVAIAFAIVFGAANGVITIARGALPLSLFGAAGYGAVIGKIARPAQIMQALAPFVLAFVIDSQSDRAALALVLVGAVLAFGCFMAIRSPRDVRAGTAG